MNERRRMIVCAECLDMFVSLRTLHADLLEPRVHERKADRASDKVLCHGHELHKLHGTVRARTTKETYYTDLVLDSGNAML